MISITLSLISVVLSSGMLYERCMFRVAPIELPNIEVLVLVGSGSRTLMLELVILVLIQLIAVLALALFLVLDWYLLLIQ